MTTFRVFWWGFLAAAVAGSTAPSRPAASATATAATRDPPLPIRPQRTRSRPARTPDGAGGLRPERPPKRGDAVDRALEVMARELAAVDGVDQRLRRLVAGRRALREQQQIDPGAGALHRALSG